MHPTLTPHRNVLAELVDELEREGNAAKRRADVTIVAAAGLTGLAYDDAIASASYQRGAQDALFNVVGRLRSLAGAHLTAIVDFGDVFDAIEARLASRPGAYVPVVVAEVLDGFLVGGRRAPAEVDLDVAIERAERYAEIIPGSTLEGRR